MQYRIEIDAWSDAESAVVRRYFGKPAALTTRYDNPATTGFEGRVLNPGNFERALYGRGSLIGPSEVGYGYIDLDNLDGALDNIFSAVDGRRIAIYQSPNGSGAYPRDWRLVLLGTMDGVERPFGAIRLLIRDRRAEVFNRPLTLDRYDGSNVLPDGVDGVAGDLEGKPKPVCYGKALNVTPPMVNTSKETYQTATANAGEQTHAISAVYTQGAAITPGTSHASLSALQGATVASGEVDDYDGAVLDGAYFRTGSTVRDVTADIQEGGSASPAQIIQRLLLGPGRLLSSDLDLASFTALDNQVAHVCGIWYGPVEATVGDAINRVSESIGAWVLPTRSGAFRVGRLTGIRGLSVASLTVSDVLADDTPIRVLDSSDTDRSLPPWRVVVRYQKNYTVQGSSVIVGSVAENTARARFLLNEYREVSASDEDRKIRNPLAPELIVDTLLDAQADAQAHADRLLALFNPNTKTVEIDLHMSELPTVEEDGVTRPIDLTDEITLTYPRYGLSGGVNLICKRIVEDHGSQIVTLELWGEFE
jgi:hypothetical protein